jgi:thioredoxin-related protein
VLEEASRPTLYQYGIRSLPALILVDGSGGELHRFTPGIQPAEAILAALD